MLYHFALSGGSLLRPPPSITGNNTIQSALYNLNSGSFASMEANYGAFDEVAEDIEAAEATVTTITICADRVRVYGTNRDGNKAGSSSMAECAASAFTGKNVS